MESCMYIMKWFIVFELSFYLYLSGGYLIRMVISRPLVSKFVIRIHCSKEYIPLSNSYIFKYVLISLP